MKFEVDNHGDLTLLKFADVQIPVRLDEYKGPALFAVGANGQESRMPFSAAGKNIFEAASDAGIITKEFSRDGDALKITLTTKNIGGLSRLFMRLGIDCYMESYSDWSDKFFPTMLRCEKTHFLGYFMSPSGRILGMCADSPCAAWSIDYNRVLYDDGENTGHRIYTVCVDLHNSVAQASNFDLDSVSVFNFYFKVVSSEAELTDFWAQRTGAPSISSAKWTYEIGEKLDIFSDGELTVIAPDGHKILSGSRLSIAGEYSVESKKNNKITAARIFVRPAFCEYLKAGGHAVFEYPQKASTHCESYYGYMTAFNYAARSDDEEYLDRLLPEFEEFYHTITENGRLKKAAAPGRVQNASTFISILVAAYRCTKDKKYIDRAAGLVHELVERQTSDGAYRNSEGVHYTCVIYPVKSLIDLYLTLKDMPEYAELSHICQNSFVPAVYDLEKNLDNIQTEGEMTFEDGMISCAVLQLAYYAMLSGGDERERFLRAAEYLLDKHECLQQNIIWDSRVRGCTLRFWETMYDVLIPQNMLSSPHGWTSWKTYATYYLYILTGNVKYLQKTMDTLGACLQCYDLGARRLNWAYINDPILKADIFVNEYGGKLQSQTVGSQYLPMISGWYRPSDSKKIIKGYGYPLQGLTSGEFSGACCDNDVHEHFNALSEIGFCAYAHQTATDEFLTYNCEILGGELKLRGEMLDTAVIYAQSPARIKFDGKTLNLQKGFNTFKL